MAISMKKYVDIKSAINTTRTATEKDLIARIFTTSASLADGVVECDTLADVGEIFASSSDEYKIASKYFNFINKYARSPKKISFAKVVTAGSLAKTTGTVKLTDDDKSTIIGSMYPSAGTLTVNGTDLSVQLGTVPMTIYNTMEYGVASINSALSNANIPISCDFDGTEAGEYWLTFQATDNSVERIELSGAVANAFKISSTYNPEIIEGSEDKTYSQVFEQIYQISNNFATFVFLGLTDSTELATLADYVKQNHPSEFMMIVPVNDSNKASIQGAVANIDGVSLELCGDTEDTGKFNFVMPMSITATTDYNKENGTVNYMFTQDSNMITVVDDDTNATANDLLKINYYGRTQQAGQKLAFYQDGVLQGNYQDQSIFVNEIWLKDALTTKYINYMLLTPNWYANKAGQAIGQSLAMDVIERAKLNGTITTEKEITEADKVYIYKITANENAWRQIYQEGFYLSTVIEKKTINGQEKFVFNYMLIYSKGDSIKKVEGLDILI